MDKRKVTRAVLVAGITMLAALLLFSAAGPASGAGRMEGPANPAAAGNPFASVYNQQWHVVYRDAAGVVWDSWYDGPNSHWNLQQINAGGLTNGHPAAGDPSASMFNQQWHVVYRDADGVVWDSWYDGPNSHWNLQQINAGGLTNGHRAAGDPVASMFNQQWHVLYRDADGVVWDSWYDGPHSHWNLQQINAGGLTTGHRAAGDPIASMYNQQWHVLYRDAMGVVWDSWYDGPNSHWNLQQINAGGLTPGQRAVGSPLASTFNQQWHVVYRDGGGVVWDSWYDGRWNLQQINAGGLTPGHRAAGDPFASMFNQQWHVLYRDADGVVWDSWYDGPNSHWNLQQINAGGLTTGHRAAGDPIASMYNQQWHVLYRDAEGMVWDSWYDGPRGQWNLQQINAGK